MIEQWQSNQPARFTCVSKWPETEDTVSILLAPEVAQTPFGFKPGQFVSLGIDIGGSSEYRAYSLSSQPDDELIQLTVKKVTNGKVSGYIVDQLNEGDVVNVLKPAGEFNCIDSGEWFAEKKKVLFVSAGCGITPVYSMANYLLKNNPDLEVTFLHAAKSKQHTIYYDQLESLSDRYPQFDLKLLLKDASGTLHHQGRLNQEILQQLVPELDEYQVFLCGPDQFMLDVETYLKNLEFDMRYFRQESFTPDNSQNSQSETDASGVSDKAADNATVKISVPSFGVEIEAGQGSTLADALEEIQLPIIIACRSGMCGSCRCKVSGKVSSRSVETLTEEEIADGVVLACSTTIEGDIEVSI